MQLKSKKGISILLAILILSFVLTAALGTSVVLVRQLKTLREVGYSVAALYAADTGIEEFLKTRDPGGIPETPLNGAKYQVFVNASSSDDCNAQNYCVKSIGTYKDTRRAIEVKY